jgi:RNA polymerase sigma factor (sigma-70 family)
VADDLAETLRHLARSRGQPLEALTADLLRHALDRETRRKQAEDALAGLTPRQREVARLAVGGRTNRQIARELWLSPETVKTHLRRALEHFDLHSKAELRLMLFDLDGDRSEARLPGD